MKSQRTQSRRHTAYIFVPLVAWRGKPSAKMLRTERQRQKLTQRYRAAQPLRPAEMHGRLVGGKFPQALAAAAARRYRLGTLGDDENLDNFLFPCRHHRADG